MAKITAEQQVKLKNERDERIVAVKTVSAEKEVAGAVDSGALPSSSGDDSNAEKEVRREDSEDTGLTRSVPDTSGKGRRTTQVISISEILSFATKTPHLN